MRNSNTAPYIHSNINRSYFAGDWLVAACPIALWAVYMFGARVLTICAICAVLSGLLDFAVAKFIFRLKNDLCFDLWAAVYGIFAAFLMPVSVPLWVPALASVFVVFAKNVRVFRGKRLFNPFVFAAAALNVAFPQIMTTFTKPFAYFSAFDFTLDAALVDCYRVISPLMYMADGSVYEDGIFAQFYGFASGNMGEIAIAAMVFASVWLFARRRADWKSVIAFLFPVLILGLAYPSSDAESNYYAFSLLFSGGAVFLSVFAVNESSTVPSTFLGRLVFGFVAGILTFALRKAGGSFEWGYFAILLLNAVSPFIEQFTKQRAVGQKSILGKLVKEK